MLLGDTTLAAALNRAVTVVEPDPSVLAGVLDALPQRSDLVLGPLALTLTSQLTNHVRRLAAANAAAYEPDLATSLNNLSNRLAEAGRDANADSARLEADELMRGSE